MNKKFVLFALVGFTVIAVVALVHSISPYITPAQLKKISNAENVQVVGWMKDVRYKDNYTEFYLCYGSSKVKVVIPEKINPIDEEIVVIGDWKDGVLYGKQILRKCHTEYIGG